LFNLVVLLFKIGRGSLLIEKLQDVQRRLALGVTNLDEARNTVDLILNGFELNIAVQREIIEVLTNIDDMKSDIDKLHLELRAAEKVVVDGAEGVAAKEAIMRSMKVRAENIRSIRRKISAANIKLERKLGFYKGMSRDLVVDIQKIHDEITYRFQEAEGMIDRLYEAIMPSETSRMYPKA